MATPKNENEHPTPTTAPAVTRQRIREEASKPRVETVWIEQWHAFAHLRVMSGTMRDSYEGEITGDRVVTGRDKSVTRTLNLRNVRARLVARCLIDPATGDLLYDYRKQADLDELGATDAAVLDTMFDAASRLNGITDDDIKALTKNLPAEANGVSGTI